MSQPLALVVPSTDVSDDSTESALAGAPSIETIVSLERFVAVRDDWEALYRTDTSAQLFLSWQWLHQLYQRRQEPICILAWRPAEGRPFAAFLPLRIGVRYNAEARRLENTLCAAGNHWADYTGVICAVSYEAEALLSLSHALAALQPRRIRLDNLRLSARRLDLLLHAFTNDAWRIVRRHLDDNDGQTSLDVAPVIALPTEVESWLQSLGSSTRQTLRRYRRKLDADPDQRIRRCDEHSLEDDLKTFHRLWIGRWQSVKGARARTLADKYVALLRDGFESGLLDIHCLDSRELTLAIHACYRDPIRRRVLFFVGARDTGSVGGPTGLLLHADRIASAIADGDRHYDFLRGDEPYKYSLGAADTRLHSFELEARALSPAATLIRRDAIALALNRIDQLRHRLSTPATRRLLAQVLDSAPTDIDAIRLMQSLDNDTTPDGEVPTDSELDAGNNKESSDHGS